MIIILLIILAVYLLFHIYTSNYKTFDNNTKNAFCLITREPNKIWLNFLKTFTISYDVYIIIDNNDFNCDDYKKQYLDLNFIQIDDAECKNAGYWGINLLLSKDVQSWDKSVYFFNHIKPNYNYVWFCEDDVYIRDVSIIKKIDDKYINTDLLTERNTINTTGNQDGWSHWWRANHHFNLPWCSSMVCICRLSNRLIKQINNHVNKHKELVFLEILFNTIAYQQNMTIKNPIELSTIVYRQEWDKNTIDKNKLYHPFKNLEDHIEMRNK